MEHRPLSWCYLAPGCLLHPHACVAQRVRILLQLLAVLPGCLTCSGVAARPPTTVLKLRQTHHRPLGVCCCPGCAGALPVSQTLDMYIFTSSFKCWSVCPMYQTAISMTQLAKARNARLPGQNDDGV